MRRFDKNNSINEANKRLELEHLEKEKIVEQVDDSDNSDDVEPIDVRKFIDKLKNLDALQLLKQKINNKVERRAAMVAMAELFDLGEKELQGVFKDIRSAKLAESEINEDITSDLIDRFKLEELVSLIIKSGVHPSMIPTYFAKIGTRLSK